MGSPPQHTYKWMKIKQFDGIQIDRYDLLGTPLGQCANSCRAFFHQEMNTTLYARYIVEAALQIPFSHDYAWAQNINLNGSLKYK